jgi:transposase
VLGEYLGCHEVLLARRARLDALIAEHAEDPQWAALVGRLRCMRGIDTLTAVGLIAEIGDFTAFAHPKQLASFLGLVPTESASERQTQAGLDHQGRIQSRTQAADRSGLALPPPPGRVAGPAPAPGRPAARRHRGRLARAAAVSARWAHLDARRAKRRTTVAVAVARELACFVWELARQPD